MDLGWASTRGRARWATVLGIVAAVALIGASLMALNRTVLPFDGWPTSPDAGTERQYLPDAPPTVLGRPGERAGGSGSGLPALGGGTLAGPLLVPAPPATTAGAPAAGATPGAPTAGGGLEVGSPTPGAPGPLAQPGVPAQLDSDGDGVPDTAERTAGTNPRTADTDGDGLPDGSEDRNRDGRRDRGETDPRHRDGPVRTRRRH